MSHLDRAGHLYELNRNRQAIEEVQRHLAEFPDDAHAFRLWAHAAARLEDAPGAFDAARRAIEREPQNGHMHFAMSVALKAADDLSGAEQAILEALRLDPEESRFYANYASLLIQLKRSREAMPLIQRGLEIDPRNRYLVFARALASWAIDLPLQAQHYLEVGLQMHPDDTNLHALRGVMLAHEGKGRDAIPHLLESLRIDPENSWAQENLVKAKKSAWWRSPLGIFTTSLLVALGICFGFVIASLDERPKQPPIVVPQPQPRSFTIEELRSMDPKVRKILFPDAAEKIEAKEGDSPVPEP